MGRAQDLLEKAMNNMKDLSENSDFGERINSGLDKLDAQKDKFFFQSLAGLPSANMLFKATEKMTSDANEQNMAEIEKIIKEIPFPIPLCVICSPNHIKKTVPATIVVTVVILKNIPGLITKFAEDSRPTDNP